MISPLTPLDFLARSACTWRDRIAVVDGDRRFTYAGFAARVERQAAALVQLGVQPGDRVAVLAPNGVMALEAHFAPMAIGAVLVMLNTRLAAGELAWILAHCGARVLLVDPQLKPWSLLPESSVIDDYEGFRRRVAHCDRRGHGRKRLHRDQLYLGTTGFPRRDVHTAAPRQRHW
jgi:fatty-acyl-CoA synthase